jgi:hypothetical protein
MIIIYVLLIVLFIIIYYILDCSKKSNFINLDIKYDNDGVYSYRLGDMILISKDERDSVSIIPSYIKQKFKNSLGGIYFERTDESNDIDLIIDILREFNLLNNNNNITLHLRLGDILCAKDNLHNEKKPIKIEKLINYIKKFKKRNIFLYTFFHNGGGGNCENLSNNYLDILKSNITNLCISTEGNPDNDLIEMINSDIHIAGNGNFSKLITLIREKLNKTTIYLN